MTSSIFAGSLPSKKKAELREIAVALHINDAGTKEDVQQRIRKHLDENQTALEDNPTFSGLFVKRKKIVQVTRVYVSLYSRCRRLVHPPQVSRHFGPF